MKTRLALAGVAVAPLTLAGCGGDDRADDAPETRPATRFAAAVPGTDAFLGTVVDRGDGRVPAYLSDGENVASWFNGKTGADGDVELTSADGARLSGRVDGDHLEGTVTLPGGGATHAVSAPVVKEPAGLYRATEQVDGQTAVGGWIVLSDGRQQGAVRTSSGFSETGSDFARPRKPVTSFTTNDTDL